MTIKPRAIYTRFLCPLFYPEGDHERIVTALRAMPDPFAKSGENVSRFLWEQASASHSLYGDELLHAVRDFLFPDCSGAKTSGNESSIGCRYLRLSPDVAGRVFHNTVVHLGRPLSVDWMRLAGMELFLTAQGAGVLSIALTVEGDDLELQDALAFNYRASQLHPSRRLLFVRPHISQDPERWARIPLDQRENVQKPPDNKTAGFWDRASRDGGEFTLHDLMQATVFSLLGDEDPDRTARGLMAYTVVRFGPEVDFARDEVRAVLGPLVAGLANIEEAGHAGAYSGEVPVANAMLNHNHWAATSHLGSAHLVSDQAPPPGQAEHPFNTERVPRVFVKYFIAFLMPLLQHMVLRRAGDEASRALLSRGAGRHGKMSEIRKRLLEFQIGGHASQISVREAVHRYYRICRTALDIDDAWSQVKQAFGEYDAELRQDEAALRQEEATRRQEEATRRQEESGRLLAQQKEMTRSMDQNLAKVAHVQVLLEILEIFIIAYYMTELVKLLHDSGLRSDTVRSWGDHWHYLLVFAGVAVFTALLVFFLQPLWRLLSRLWTPRVDTLGEPIDRPTKAGHDG